MREWLTTTDHKKIGILYLLTALFFFLAGGFLALLIRIQLMHPGNTFVAPDTYNQLFTMHGSLMIFLFAVPIGVGGFGNYLVPLLIGARDVAFPRLNAISYWIYLAGGLIFAASMLLTEPNPNGWTNYPPLSNQVYSPSLGVDMWIFGIHLVGVSSIMGGINFIVTILHLRAPGMTLHKMPLFVWTVFVTAWLQLIVTPVLAGVITMLLLDRRLGTGFFVPALGGDPIMWQHLFWFYSHPAVYIMILPAFGMISEVVPVFSRKPIFGYLAIAYSSVFIGLYGLLVWGHHMFATGIPAGERLFYMVITMLIAVPTGIKIFSWIATMWGGSLEYRTPMLFAIGFIAFFLIGGLSGIYLASIPVDIQVTHTYFIVAHLHYVLFAGTVMGIFAGLYYWFPKMSGRLFNETLGKWHFWLTLLSMNVVFFPMHTLGLAGMPRRFYTYPAQFADTNYWISLGAYVLAVAQILPLINLIWAARHGPEAGDDPWQGRTLEWTVSSPPPPYNFDDLPRIS